MTQILVLLDRGLKIHIISILKDIVEKLGDIHKQMSDFSREGNHKKEPKLILGMKKLLIGLNNRQDITEERISELEKETI